ncbi:hypothetical protein BBX50_16455 [Ensifer sp. LC11]|nr:hypothetical protein BBX50_16455 [Ensifer sp. LC11]
MSGLARNLEHAPFDPAGIDKAIDGGLHRRARDLQLLRHLDLTAPAPACIGIGRDPEQAKHIEIAAHQSTVEHRPRRDHGETWTAHMLPPSGASCAAPRKALNRPHIKTNL